MFNNKNAPQIFSHRIYLVETDAFSLIEKGSALVVSQVPDEEIAAGNIIIFEDAAEKPFVAEVQESTLDNGVYTYRIKNDVGSEMVIGPSHVLGKGMYYSEFLGGFISFALSPAGVCCMAVMPCAAFIVLEIIFAIKHRDNQSDFEPVNKQNEVPTYIPNYREVEEKESPAFVDERQRLMEEAGLFAPPQKKPVPKPEARAPISERDIDKLIRETKAKHMGTSYAEEAPRRQAPPPQRPAPPPSRPAAEPRPRPITPSVIIDEEETRNIFTRQEERRPSRIDNLHSEMADKPSGNSFLPERDDEPIRRYEPKRRTAPKAAPRVSRLDSLLQEDSADNHYDIDDILRSLDKK